MTRAPLPPGFAAELAAIVGERYASTALRDRIAYGYDATGELYLPDAVVHPADAEEVQRVVRLCKRNRVPLIARGAGTNVSGGTLAERGGVVVNMGRMNRILSVDPPNRTATVQPGCTNLALQEALSPLGFFYAPDPSSHRVSTIGGNCAENAGGPHCVKYGVTANHVLGLKVVLEDGELVTVGSSLEEMDGLDLPALFIGSEGTLGVIVEVTVRILPLPPHTRTLLAVFDDLDACARAVSAIIAARIVPAALELMDKAMIEVVNQSIAAGYPADAEGVLVIEIDGPRETIDRQVGRIGAICREAGARQVQSARSEAERALLWRGRRVAFGALARLSAHIWGQDVTVPRDQLPSMLRQVVQISRRHGLRIATVAHAGDGNLHPTMAYDPRDPEQVRRVRQADREIMEACVRLGGAISGEHGIGIDKRPNMELQHGPLALAAMRAVKRALDPDGILNPGKKIPERVGGF